MKKLTITTLIISAVILSGCFTKPQTNSNQPINQNVNQNTGTNQNINAVPTTTEAIDTSNWKTYRNEEYGFKLKYPGDWMVEQLDNKRMGFYPPNKSRGYEYVGDIIVSILSAPSGMSTTDFINSLASVYQPTSQTINGLNIYVSYSVPAMIPCDSYIIHFNNSEFIEFIVFNNQNKIAESIIKTISKL